MSFNEKTLDLKNRRQIFSFIRKYPGIYLRKLSRKLNIPKTTLIYHLDYLEKRGYTEKKNEGKYTRYYITQNVGTIEKNYYIFLDKRLLEILFCYFSYKIVPLKE